MGSLTVNNWRGTDMASKAFTVTDELKEKINAAAKGFVAETGGSEAAFLEAMLGAWQTGQAKAALAGRSDEIEHVERLLSGIKTAYLNSLAMAAAAREDAAEAMDAEIRKAKAVQGTLQSTIDLLKAKLDEAKEKEQEIQGLHEALENAKATRESAEAAAAQEREAREQADRERADLSRLFQEQITEAKAKAEEMSEEVEAAKAVEKERRELLLKVTALEAAGKESKKQVEELQNTISKMKKEAEAVETAHQAELEQLKGRYAEKAEVAAERAANKLEAALLAERKAAEERVEMVKRELDEARTNFAAKLKELSGNGVAKTAKKQ